MSILKQNTTKIQVFFQRQDLETYEQTRESLALLKILSQSKKSLNEGKYKTHTKAFHDLKKQVEKIKRDYIKP